MQVNIERKVPVIVRPDYTVSFERTNSLTFIHCDIHTRWSSSVKSALLEDWQTLTSVHDAPILALHVPGDRKHEKFLSMFGFSKIGSFVDQTDTELDTYIYTGQ